MHTEADVIARLRDGKARILRDGWSNNGPFDGKKCCTVAALGAFEFMLDDHFANNEVDELIHAAWGALQVTGDIDAIGPWNDDPDRTLDDVLDLYDRTIARLEAAMVTA